MIDRDLNDLHPDLLPLAKEWIEQCKDQGLKVGVCETYRSKADQDVAYAKGRTIPGKIITNAQGGQSPHNCTLEDGTPAAKAFDFFIIGDDGKCDWNAADDKWKLAISIGQKLGLVSGSGFKAKDCDHMELPNWKENYFA